MAARIFLAGASGVIGRSLARQLRDAGHLVVGATRTTQGREALQALGIEAVMVDVFDAPTLTRAVSDVAPEVVIHQLTSLAGGIDPASATETIARNARIRRVGTANLVAAARVAGARRLIAQSIAWAYAPKPPPYRESDPLDTEAGGLRALSVREGVIPLEDAVLGQRDMDGIVLRYGQLYGPGAWTETPKGSSPVHVDAAAHAALLAIHRGAAGPYNIADPGGEVSIDKAEAELGWRPDVRLAPGERRESLSS
ncbi:NAD-dependent epimerase/dehydratase family protein [Chelatococcus reniformis]|uniref:dTDP-glucose 4,6-dehydratase n=1 Tax=Chelatococcus reniformis TaxID=1494448 RepID=A0A916TZ18_9HYPH|nr:NAD(P)-dependent oxidoreductase [Chelatococcus reniformis]GGC45800.1 dTDP-glucose 4,6-dehydratase [Chelatococcus reniformis]